MATIREIQAEFKARASGFQQTINGMKNDLKGLGDRAKTNAEKMSKQFDKASKNIKKSSEKMTKYVTVPLGAIGGAAAKMTSDVNTGVTQLNSMMGATGDEAKQLEKDFEAVWKSGIGENPEQVARTMGIIKQNVQGINDGEPLQKVTRDVINLAKVTDADVSEVTRGLNQMMTSFGISADEAMDLFAKGSQEGLDFSKEMFDNVAEYAPLFEQAGYSADEYFSLLANGAKGAYNLDYINDFMKEFDIRVRDGSTTTADAMALMSDSTQDLFSRFENGEATTKELFDTIIPELEAMDDQILANQIGVDLFGVKFEDMGAKTVYSLDDVNESMDDSAGSMDAMSEMQEKAFGTRVQKAIRTVGDALEPVGQTLLDMVQRALPYIERLANWFANLNPNVQMFATVVGIVAAALGPFLAMLAVFLSSIANLIPLILKIGPLFAKLAPILKYVRIAFVALTGPIGMIVTAVVGLALIIYKNWDSIWNWTKDIFGKTFDWLTNTWNSAITWISEKASQIVSGIAGAWNSAYDWTVNIFTKIVNFFSNIWNSIYTTIRDFLLKIWNKTVEILTPFIEFFDFIFSTIFSAVSTIMGAVFTLIWEILKAIYNKVKEILTNVWNFWVGIWTKISNFVTKIATSIYNFIKKIFTNVYNFFKNIFLQIYNYIADTVNKIQSHIKKRFQDSYNSTRSIFTKVWDFLKNIWSKIWSTVSEPVTRIFNKVRDTWNNLKTKTTEIFSDIYNAIKKKFNQIVDQAKELPGKIGDGIGKMASKVGSGITTVINKMASVLGKGVNGVLGGINWVLDKIGSDEKIDTWDVPQWAKGTRKGSHPGGLAFVGDGKGNNAGSELMRTPDGNLYLSPDRKTLLNMPKGTQVLSAKQTRGLMSGLPQYSNGIGDLLEGTKNVAKKVGSGIASGAKAVGRGVKKGASKVGDWAGNVWDYASNPSKLLDIALDLFNVEIPSGVGMIEDIAKAGFYKIKDNAVDYIKKQFDKLMSFGSNASGNVTSWITAARGFAGVPSSWQSALETIAMKESGGRTGPSTINRWDSNWTRGTPSMGLMQTIRPTFEAYKGRGLNNIMNPVHNAVAAINYIKSRYGSVFNVPGIRALAQGKPYVGYEDGGIVNSKQLAWIADGGWAESIISHDPAKKASQFDIWNKTGHDLGFIDKDKAEKAEQIVQNLTINSAKQLSPSEIARKNLQAMRRMGMEWGKA